MGIRQTFIAPVPTRRTSPTHRSKQRSHQGWRCRRKATLRATIESVHSKTGIASLEDGTWFKLICGASSQDTPSIRNLCEIYTAAGVDCIDVAADHAIIEAARKGIAAGMRQRRWEQPLLMVSINDDSDPHFRKAVFEIKDCLDGCPMPCATICPADAINERGVLQSLCYGCGRCIPVCPVGVIQAKEYVHETAHVREVISSGVDCLEIHTSRGHLAEFSNLWLEIEDVVVQHLKLVAVSFPSLGTDEEIGKALEEMWRTISGNGRFVECGVTMLWQVDGRPMSGDIGRGTAGRAVALGERVGRILRKKAVGGHVQLAGGTNDATVGLLQKRALLRKEIEATKFSVSGIAVGGHARKVS